MYLYFGKLKICRMEVFSCKNFKILLTLCVHYNIIDVYTKRGENLSTKTGRPQSENPKNVQVKFRADKQTVEDIDYCCKALNKTKSDIIRMGINKVKSEIKEKK